MPLREAISALVLHFVPPTLREADPATVRRARLCVAYNLTIPLWGPGFVALLWWLGLPEIAALVGAGTVLAVVPLFTLRWTGSLVATGNVITAYGVVLLVSAAWLEGGVFAPGIIWFPLAPMIALLAAGRRSGIAWTAVMVGITLAFHVLRWWDALPHFELTGEPLAVLQTSLACGAIVLFSVVAGLFESLKADALRALEQANRELVAARDQAEAATRAKSDFLATMSHEIRTPLHGIFGMTELALDTSDDAERREFIRRSRACAETLLSIINDILDFSRIEAGKLVLEAAVFDVRAVVDGVLDTLAIEVGRKGLELIGCVDDDVPARVTGDPGRLRQILINLAGNAVKFTDAGEIVIHVGRAATEDPPGTIVLEGTVRDTGVGVPPEKRAAIFEAFAQADTSDTRRHGGTGLGLAITQRLVALMGGKLALDATLGAGSTFRFTVTVGCAGPAAAPGPAGLAGLRALVVDGVPASRRHLAHTLRSWGIEPLTAGDGDAARALLASSAAAGMPVDLAIVDLALREADGGSTAHRLGGHGPNGVRMRMVGLGRPAGRVEPCGVEAVVARPITTSALRGALGAALDGAHGALRRAASAG